MQSKLSIIAGVLLMVLSGCQSMPPIHTVSHVDP